jgi:hypothetical protein
MDPTSATLLQEGKRFPLTGRLKEKLKREGLADCECLFLKAVQLNPCKGWKAADHSLLLLGLSLLHQERKLAFRQ